MLRCRNPPRPSPLRTKLSASSASRPPPVFILKASDSHQTRGFRLGDYGYRFLGRLNTKSSSSDRLRSKNEDASEKHIKAYLARQEEALERLKASKAAVRREFWPHFAPRTNQGTQPASQQPKASEGVGAAASKQSKKETEYIIDPITNRKVLVHARSDAGDDRPVQNYRSYYSEFTASGSPWASRIWRNQNRVHSMGKPPINKPSPFNDLKSSDHCDSLEPLTASQKPRKEAQPEVGTSATQSRWPDSEEYALNHLPPEEPHDQHVDAHKSVVSKKDSLSSELDRYRPTEFDEVKDNIPDDLPADEELRKYKPYFYNEDTNGISAQKALKNSDLDNSSSREHKDDVANDQPFERYGDFEKYRMFRYKDYGKKTTSERDFVAENLKDYEEKGRKTSNFDPSKPFYGQSSWILPKMKLPDEHVFSKRDQAPNNATQTHSHAAEDNCRQDLEQSMNTHNEASDAMDREIRDDLHKAHQNARNDNSASNTRNFTGNYVKDFPEEFSGSWLAQCLSGGDTPKSSKIPYEEDTTAKIRGPEEDSFDKFASTAKPSVLQPALDRYNDDKVEVGTTPDRCATGSSQTPSKGSRERVETDLFSTEPQGLETSYVEECGGRQTMPVYTKTYGGEPGQVLPKRQVENLSGTTSEPSLESHSEPFYQRDPEIDGKLPTALHRSTAEADSTKKDEATVYKVLAYEPSMQAVKTAETTSNIPDSMPPLSPAAVLLRLSNPTKFLPYFEPLQAEGFEIVSGSGDLLVFRKVRTARSMQMNKHPVNPIDMMGKPMAFPNAAAFASPTGFVNYDVPRVEEEVQDPPFKSNITVRREEPVFSGPKTPQDWRAPKRRKSGKVRRFFYGTLWVACIAYLLGLISECFIGARGRVKASIRERVAESETQRREERRAERQPKPAMLLGYDGWVLCGLLVILWKLLIGFG
ncbi:hypothetical protein GGR56DRAFT_347482 [Xylariaceae sp. FL0804]|nr:hypothetical protein GGR56DRAFT_347482 [Xylariaceae sp. FL0804]